MNDDIGLVSRDLIPLLDVDFAISDAQTLYKTRGPLLYMSNPWWEKTNRHLLIAHLCRLYEFCVKHKLSYRDAIKFNNRTIYHMYPTGRVVVRETSQSIGSTTLRAHFRNLSGQFKDVWSSVFELEERFWAVQKILSGTLDSQGAITKVGSKRSYTLWESFDGIRKISREKGLMPLDFLDYALAHTKPCNAFKLSASIGSSVARTTGVIKAALPGIWAHPAFKRSGVITETPKNWLKDIGFGDVNLVSGSLPLGFYLAKEHLGVNGNMADVIEVAPSGQYRTRDGSIFNGDFWFKDKRNPWLVIQINDNNASKIDPDSWYNPSRYDDIPTVVELQTWAPNGPWTRVWDSKTGKPLSPQAGRISLKVK